MMLLEDEVYIGTKKLLEAEGWILLAGQPPDGCNHLPVVEIKSLMREGIGSKYAFKPDLIAVKGTLVLIIECKPDRSKADEEKLRNILNDQKRIEALFNEMQQRHLLRKHRIELDIGTFSKWVRGALAHSGEKKPIEGLYCIVVRSIEGSGWILPPIS
jgi:hypothetical protein